MKVNFYLANELCAILKFIEQSSCFNRVNDIESADYVIYENVIQNRGKKGNADLKIISKTYLATKKIIVFIIDDYEKRYNYYSNLILLRTSLVSTLQRKNEFTLPYIWDYKKLAFPTSPSTAFATVGFCGIVSKPRKKIVSAFEKNNKIICDFVKQKKFWGGSPHAADVVKLFYTNLQNNQYIICNRGRGNFSMRFYETLATGRVPVLVNTKMNLPFKDSINWDEIIIIKKNEKDCVTAVIQDHAENGFEQRQQKGVAIFQKYFSLENFFNVLMVELNK